LFLFEPTISASYWILSALTTHLLVIMYVLMFGAVIRLRYTQPDRPRPYKIPGGLPGCGSWPG
jgi:amino acid transporter